MSRIVILGFHGTLGKEFLPLIGNHEVITPFHNELDVKDTFNVINYIEDIRPDIVIHCAAITDNRFAEKNPEITIKTNIIGTANVACACIRTGARMVYLSSDYTYPGDHGNYKETDPVKPFNFYAWSKLAGEGATQGVKNHLIIRTSFGKNEFSYPQAFTDKWSSKDYANVIAPMIWEAALSPLTGILNLGTERKTLYSHAVERSPDVKPVKIAETNFFTPYDTSLNLQKWQDYKSSKAKVKALTECRCCGSTRLFKYLDLGLMPLPNHLEYDAVRAKNVERFPLQVLFCQDCGLSQLSVVVAPEVMYSYYTYQSGVNQGYVDHCHDMARVLIPETESMVKFFHIDAAGNDGTLLKEFKEWAKGKLSYSCLNVDPASNLCAISEAAGIPAMNDFWSLETAKIVRAKYGPADLITATNVFAHVDDITDFLQASRHALSKKGALILEFPYIQKFIDDLEWDTTYSEHLSYFSLNPIHQLCKKLDLQVTDAELIEIHGGSVRITITHSGEYETNERCYQLFQDEITSGYQHIDKYVDYQNNVKDVIDQFSTGILSLKKEGAKIAAFAASAKGSILLNSSGMNTDLIETIIDETPAKIGKFSPGSGIPIVGLRWLDKNKPDYIIILSWNFMDAIIKKCRDAGFDGQFIVGIPEFKII